MLLGVMVMAHPVTCKPTQMRYQHNAGFKNIGRERKTKKRRSTAEDEKVNRLGLNKPWLKPSCVQLCEPFQSQTPSRCSSDVKANR
jgi:hypothetical protein